MKSQYLYFLLFILFAPLTQADITLKSNQQTKQASNNEITFGKQAKVCVNKTGNRNMDRKLAFFEARKELATQVQLAVEIVTKDYQRQNKNNTNKISSQTLEEKSKMIVSQTLNGSYPIKQGYEKKQDDTYYCIIMVLKNPVDDVKDLNEAITQNELTSNLATEYHSKTLEYTNNYQSIR